MRSFGRQGDLYSYQLCREQFFGKKLRLILIKRQLRLFIVLTVSIQNHKTTFIEQEDILLGQNRFGFLCCSRMKGMNGPDYILPVSSFYIDKLKKLSKLIFN